jgi:hypothetical protein
VSQQNGAGSCVVEGSCAALVRRVAVARASFLANCRPLAGPRAFDRHLREMVAGGDDIHARALKAMKGRWKHPISGMGWYRAAKRNFAKLPQD